AALDHIVESAAISSSAQRVLVITHGGAIRLLRCAAEQRSYSDMANIEVPHASLHALSWPLATGSS
ncbi:MAG: histidine phosphatase family protein, partial [Dokdonella sp.]